MCGNVASECAGRGLVGFFFCNGGFNVALINLKIGLLRQPPPSANCFS